MTIYSAELERPASQLSFIIYSDRWWTCAIPTPSFSSFYTARWHTMITKYIVTGQPVTHQSISIVFYFRSSVTCQKSEHVSSTYTRMVGIWNRGCHVWYRGPPLYTKMYSCIYIYIYIGLDPLFRAAAEQKAPQWQFKCCRQNRVPLYYIVQDTAGSMRFNHHNCWIHTAHTVS